MKETAEDVLLALGLEKLKEGGVRSLKVRQLCKEVGISPGTFTSHFKTRKNYIERVLEAWYEPLKETVKDTSIHPQGSALEQLRALLLRSAHFFRNNAGEMLQLIMDVSAGEAEVQHLLSVARLNHINWIRDAIRKAQESGEIVLSPVDQILFYLFGATNFATLIYRIFPAMPQEEIRDFTELLQELTDESSVVQRLDWALQGITTHKHS